VPAEEAAAPEEEPLATKVEVAAAPTKPEDKWVYLRTQLKAMINDDSVAERVMTMLDTHNQKKSCDEKFVPLPALEKSQRKAIHNWIRESLTCARADTLEGRIRIWHVQFEKEMPNYKKFWDHSNDNNKRDNNHTRGGRSNKRSKKAWPENRPDFLQFVLYKESMDTPTAAKELSRKGSKARIGFAGMKEAWDHDTILYHVQDGTTANHWGSSICRWRQYQGKRIRHGASWKL
jgi:hypothetical protein